MPKALVLAMKKLKERVDGISPVTLGYFDEPAHDGCEGGLMVVNLLEGMRGGHVRLEEKVDSYIPDIALYQDGADTPHVVIEVVNTSPPSDAKRNFYERQGITAYELQVSDGDNILAAVRRTGVRLHALTCNPCGKRQRAELELIKARLFSHMAENIRSFVGLKTYKNETQEYIVGTYDPSVEQQWSWGEPETFGLCPTEARWSSPPRVNPIETSSLNKQTFMAFMFLCIENFAELWRGEDDERIEKELFKTMVYYSQDLLDAVHVADADKRSY